MRGHDGHGSGDWDAPRGARKHKGIDYSMVAGSAVLSLTDGKVTKVGYPYGDDLTFRYVQVTSNDLDLRYFYIDPMVKLGDKITRNQVLGSLQDLTGRYMDITNHCHFEIKQDGEYLNPKRVIGDL